MRILKCSLKKKLIAVLVFIVVLIISMAVLFSYNIISSINSTMYLSRSKQLSSMSSEMLDSNKVKTIRDRVMEIYNNTDNRVSSEDWGSPEFDEYLHLYDSVSESNEFKETQKLLRTIQDNNGLWAVYLVWLDEKSDTTIYLVDAAYEDNCKPGCFDNGMYEVDREALKNPKNGIAPDITNTEEYGWLVASGSPIFADGELVAFVGVDISMNQVMSERNHFLFVSCGALSLLALIAIIISIIMIDKMIVRPINLLSDTSKKYWSGENTSVRNEFSQIQINTGDELETLSDSMKQMEQNINENITKILETTQMLIQTRKHAEEMNYAANVDALTKVRNKRAYDIEIQHINDEINDHDINVGIAMIDLNYLKLTNDIYGHEQGNIALQTLCKTICNTFYHSPVFRIGGDEFVVILRNSDYENLDELKVRLDKKLFMLQAGKKPGEGVSAAVGYAIYDSKIDKNMDDVFKRADHEMYEQKKRMKAERK